MADLSVTFDLEDSTNKLHLYQIAGNGEIEGVPFQVSHIIGGGLWIKIGEKRYTLTIEEFVTKIYEALQERQSE